ncbi:MAG: helix-turn-helix transcriptional regulator [Treponema sp.]|nr:helix-turn-helix transcriptional regulator [Treponema sp.]
MNFWETVDSELEYQNKERKDLAKAAGFDVSNIGKGIKNGGVPLADTAVRIAHFLNVSVEYLVSGGKSIGFDGNDELCGDFQKFFCYRKLINKIDSMPAKTKSAIVEMFEKI